MSAAGLIAGLGLADPDAALAALRKYQELLRKWNQRVNLVGPAVTGELDEVHLPDAVAVARNLPAGTRRLVDVGSGGGLPSAMVAILAPAVEVTALEPVRKKHAFLAAVRRELPLPNYRPLGERDDDHLSRTDFRPYDIATSRATFELPVWLERGARLVRPGGRVLGLEGAQRFELPAGARRIGYGAGDRSRSLVVLPIPV